jgi:hypothetical protein
MLLLNSYVAINYTQAPSVQHCRASFDDQLAHTYTRKVYLEYRDTYDKSTAFRMVSNPEVGNEVVKNTGSHNISIDELVHDVLSE